MAGFKVLGFAGSLRKGSYNRMLLRAAAALSPKGAEVEIFDLEGIPPYNADLEADMPLKARELKAKVLAADAILIVTPEYNFSIPGVLKNAIDWASRPNRDNSFDGKAVAVMGASTGMLGTARAQYHLRQTFVYLNMYAVNKPEVMIGQAAQKFDKDGNLTDETAKKLIGQQLEKLVELAKKLK